MDFWSDGRIHGDEKSALNSKRKICGDEEDDDETVQRKRRRANVSCCSRCDEIFETERELIIHSASHLRIDRRINCSKCSNYFDRPENYFSHSCHRRRKNTKPEVIYSCGICSEEFPTKRNLITHQFTHPEYKNTLCAQCGQIFPTHAEKTAHIRAHRQNWKQSPRVVALAICEICGKSMNKFNLKQHMEAIHSEAPVMCDECGEICRNEKHLEKHKLTEHVSEKPEICPFCSFRSHEAASKRQHLTWKHFGPDGFMEYQVKAGVEKPFKCTQCDKEYTTQLALDEHRIFHGERTYKCKKCGWKCYTNYHLTAHNITFHFKNPLNIFKPVPLTCDFCNEFSGNRWELYMHEMNCPNRTTSDGPDHSSFMKKTDQGNWVCEQCNKSYTKKSTLQYHYRAVHSGTHQFICEICGRGVNSKSNLRAHMIRKHGGGFECGHCELRFVNFKQLEEHQAEDHLLPISNNARDSEEPKEKASVTRGKKDCSKLIQALVALDGKESYKVVLMSKE